MEGPTPVSALIHAATMVTAGVYLIVRSGPIFDLSADARLAVTIVGAATLLFGAIISCAKDDIKKALAGSTMSQIGYMMLAAGIGPAGYPFAIALLLAHGFYKAGLFLDAGSIMHGMNDEVDMRRYGGLSAVMRITFITFAACYLAIIGIPPFSGFFAKDTVIDAAYPRGRHHGLDRGHLRGDRRGPHRVLHDPGHVHDLRREAPLGGGRPPARGAPVMTWPVILLAIGAVGFGAFEILGDRLAKFLGPVTRLHPARAGRSSVPAGIVALVLIVIGIGVLAWALYGRRPVPDTAPAAGFPVTAARKDLYGDAINESLLMRPGQWLTRLSVYFDNRGVDGLVNTVAAVIGGTSGRLRRIQTGFVRSYALSMFLGGVLLVGALLLARI